MLLAAAYAPLILDLFLDLLLLVAHDHLELHHVNASSHEASAVILEVPVHEDLLVRDKAVSTELRAVTRYQDGCIVPILTEEVIFSGWIWKAAVMGFPILLQ